MAGKLKTENVDKNPKGEKVSFDNNTDYVAITLKEDGKTYVEHKLFAKKLVDRDLAEYDKKADLENVKPNTQILD